MQERQINITACQHLCTRVVCTRLHTLIINIITQSTPNTFAGHSNQFWNNLLHCPSQLINLCGVKIKFVLLEHLIYNTIYIIAQRQVSSAINYLLRKKSSVQYLWKNHLQRYCQHILIITRFIVPVGQIQIFLYVW